MRRIWFILVVMASMLALVSCGGTEEPTATAPAVESTKAPEIKPTEPAVAEQTKAPEGLTGQLQLAGSTTVQPLAEELAEAFMAMNPGLVIEIQGGGSSQGVTMAGEGTVDIGNASREVKGSEFEQFPDLMVHTIAFDGIAIVTHPDVTLPTLSVEQVRNIFAGEITNFAEVGGPDADINVVSREEGSGTRAAFEELVMAYKDAAGESQEKPIFERALLQQSNGQVRTAVSTTPNTIAYLSFGFLDSSVSAVPIDGVEPTPGNVKAGTYPIFRPLNMLTKGAPDALAQAFIDYILSDAGQAIVGADYITVTGEAEAQAPAPTAEPAPAGLTGQLQLAGSTTVQPLAEELAEAFMALNPGLVIEIQGGGSSQGVTMAGEGTVDIGNASREVKGSEFEQFPNLMVHTIAFDGIAVVTHPDVADLNLTVEQVRNIFAGEIANFAEVGGPDADIVVVSREEGSGTRAAFQELVMAYKDEAGESQEKPIYERALLQQSNGQVRTTVSTTPNSIAYLSFGFLDDTTKPVKIDGALPLVINVKAGSYPIVRPLNMLTNGAPNEAAQAYLDYIMGPEGQAIVGQDYITVAYQPPTDLSGQLQLAGSTTVQPLAEELAEAFMALNPGLVIEIQGGGSSQGVTMGGEGTVDIGNASRAIKGSEFEQFPNLQVFVIAYDGIAIVTHPGVELPGLTVEQVRNIFAGEITNYGEVGGPDADIVVVSREEGSGTRAAFEELVMAYKDAAGESQEKLIFERALLQQSNGQVRTAVSTTPNAIAYLSFGFLDESVRNVSIDGVEPSVANVKNGSYPIYRPLNMLTNGAPSSLAEAFITFILSPFGQEIVAQDYITAD